MFVAYNPSRDKKISGANPIKVLSFHDLLFLILRVLFLFCIIRINTKAKSKEGKERIILNRKEKQRSKPSVVAEKSSLEISFIQKYIFILDLFWNTGFL